MRTGADYRSALDDGRAVYVDGQRVSDVADHPAFAGVVATMASLYDAAHLEGSDLVDPETGRLALFTVPRTWTQHERRKAAPRRGPAWPTGSSGVGPTTWPACSPGSCRGPSCSTPIATSWARASSGTRTTPPSTACGSRTRSSRPR